MQIDPSYIDFDPDFYANSNPDLAGIKRDDLRTHFVSYGIFEGRHGSGKYTRLEFLKQIETNKDCLELGPFCNPAIAGTKVKYFDVNDTKGLKKRAKEHQIDPSNIPHIDYVDPMGDLRSIKRQKFDYVFSAHTIEHQYDLIAHLNNVSNLLKPDGRYFVICPDHRYCFDHFQTVTSIQKVIDDSYASKTRHGIFNILNYFSKVTHNDPVRHWSKDHGQVGEVPDPIANLRKGISHYQSHGEDYIDVHGYYFTPMSFAGIVHTLDVLGLVEMSVEKVMPTVRNNFEFFAILRKNN